MRAVEFTKEHVERFRDRFPATFSQDECWEWPGSRFTSGYGRVHLRMDGVDRTLKAHRIAYVLFKGSLSTDELVRHTCDNPPCANPRHLLKGTPADNSRDAMERDRLPRGESHGRAKVSERDVIDARYQAAVGRPVPSISRCLGVDPVNVRALLRGEIWARVPMPSGVGVVEGIEWPEIKLQGSRHGGAKLEESDVLEIRERTGDGESLSAVARDYGVTPQLIWRIHHRKSWTHI